MRLRHAGRRLLPCGQVAKRSAVGWVADDVDTIPARVLGLVQGVVGGGEEFDQLVCGPR
jgi:hypothetical protein